MLQRKIVQAYFFNSLIQPLIEIVKFDALNLSQSSADREPEVLDIGFGTGFLGSLLTLGDISYTGYDLSDVAAEDSAAMCRKGRYLIRNIVQSPAQKSDVIIASEVLFHIVDDSQWMAAIGNIAAGMRPASIFMFTETFVDAINPGPPHFKPRTRAMYVEALAAHGLRFTRHDELRLAAIPVFSQYSNFQKTVHFARPAG